MKEKDEDASIIKSVLKDLANHNLQLNPGVQLESKTDLYQHLKNIEEELDSEIKKFDNKQSLKANMEELHNYNSIKDATQSLLGSISNQTGASISELHRLFNL